MQLCKLVIANVLRKAGAPGAQLFDQFRSYRHRDSWPGEEPLLNAVVRQHAQELLAISMSHQKCSCQHFQMRGEGCNAKPMLP